MPSTTDYSSMSQSNIGAAAAAAAATAAALQQDFQLPVIASHSQESLLSNAFDLIGGSTAAQEFINHMDLYAVQQQQQLQLQRQQQQQQQLQQQQQQQQQLNYHQQQQHHYQSQQSIASSTSTSPSSPSSIIQMSQYNNHHHHHHQSSPPMNKQQQQQQHSISLTTSPIQQQLTSSSSSSSSLKIHYQHQPHQLPQKNIRAGTNAATTLFNNNNNNNTNNFNNNSHQQHPSYQQHQQQLQQHFNINNHHQNQNMDAQQQQQNATTNVAQTSTLVSTNSNNSNNNNITTSTAVSNTATSTSTVSASSQHQHQHQLHQQQHQQHSHGGNVSPYKSCWCIGESVCSGIEGEIENNNNNTHSHHGDSTYHMKILVPAVASGAIIGKGGETIASLQKDTGARVKMSKSHDFYPGTTERVCLITGSVEGIMTVLDFIMDKIREKPDLTTKIIDSESKQTQERDKQVKILVPNSTAGMIIGKGGAFIKQIKEESGSYVQISQKPKDISLQERCITIIGDKENNKSACKMILSKIVEDPQSGTCLNVSYADVSGPVANFNPTGSPYATNSNAINSSTASLNSTLGTSIGGAASAAGLLVNGTGINLSLNLGTPNPAPNMAVATQLLEHIKVAMRGAGYSDNATTEVCAALGVLAKYGVLGMNVGVPHANGAHTTLGSYLGVSTLDQQTAAAATAANAGNVFGAVGQVNLDQYTAAAAAAAAAAASRPTQSQLEAAAAAAQFDPFRHLSSAAAQATTPVSLNNNSFGLTAATGAGAASALTGLSKSPTPGDLGAKDSKNVEIPEVIVGAILGPNGRSLVEIQHVSGANVQISKKGIFAPGTRNRIVTITGQPSAIAKAQFLIEQKINEEETKRARQIPLTTVVN